MSIQIRYIAEISNVARQGGGLWSFRINNFIRGGTFWSAVYADLK